ncbi:MAG: type II toxin-antitoxin system HicB family antitoxin [Candidatus Lambdaproteobacteria bacterium]|nr:type II toxin-antitoxin system HicB family antitoxin [Candidatus Lambdaproteobacteria bacterium]
MKSYLFRVVVEEDVQEDGTKAFHGYCPALRGCHTWGHTRQEALARIQEAVLLYVEDLVEAGEPIPVDPEKGVTEHPAPSVVVNV